MSQPSRPILLAALMALMVSVAAFSQASDPDALKKIVRDRCLPNHQQGKPPQPCAALDIDRGVDKGFAILKDRNGATQYLLITTGVVTGIEDPQLLEPSSPNYWADSWAARSFVDERAGKALPRDFISLALNSAFGRTQNQYHIHIDCVRADVRQALKDSEASIGENWSTMATPFNDHFYKVRKVTGETLAADPFKLVAEQGEEVRSAMGRQTIVVIGASFKDGMPGFYLLSDSVNIGAFNRASGEELQDHSCALADRLR